MKYIFSLLLLLVCCLSKAQTKPTQNFALLVNPNITVTGKETIDANQLYKGQMVRFGFNIINPSLSEVVKAGSCQLQINLGDKLKVAQKDFATKMPLSNYFKWST